MDQNERQVIDGLFTKLNQVNGQVGQRDAEAERYIQDQIARLPAAPYYMAQAILVQEQALGNLQSRIQELEQASQQRQAGGGGFLSGLFGGGTQQAQRPARPQVPQTIPPQYLQQGATAGSPWGGGRGMGGGGGGFLAGAMQTALGVAGGMLIADALTDAFSGGAAEAAEMADGATDMAGLEEAPAEEMAMEDAGFGDEEF